MVYRKPATAFILTVKQQPCDDWSGSKWFQGRAAFTVQVQRVGLLTLSRVKARMSHSVLKVKLVSLRGNIRSDAMAYEASQLANFNQGNIRGNRGRKLC